MGGVSDKNIFLTTNVMMSGEEEKKMKKMNEKMKGKNGKNGGKGQDEHGSDDIVLRTILARDQRSWSALRTKRLREILEKEEDVVGAEKLLNRMASNGVADERQFAVVMRGGERESDGCSVRNHRLLERMVESGVPPTIRVYNAMLRQCLFEGLDVETMQSQFYSAVEKMTHRVKSQEGERSIEKKKLIQKNRTTRILLERNEQDWSNLRMRELKRLRDVGDEDNAFKLLDMFITNKCVTKYQLALYRKDHYSW